MAFIILRFSQCKAQEPLNLKYYSMVLYGLQENQESHVGKITVNFRLEGANIVVVGKKFHRGSVRWSKKLSEWSFLLINGIRRQWGWLTFVYVAWQVPFAKIMVVLKNVPPYNTCRGNSDKEARDVSTVWKVLQDGK